MVIRVITRSRTTAASARRTYRSIIMKNPAVAAAVDDDGDLTAMLPTASAMVSRRMLRSVLVLRSMMVMIVVDRRCLSSESRKDLER